MKRMIALGILILFLLTPLMTMIVQRAIADPSPTVGLGVLTVLGTTQDAQGNWIVNPGVTYTMNITEVEFNHADISVHGKYTNGFDWSIVIGIDIAATGTMANGRGWFYVFSVTIPGEAGCTGTVHYRKGASDTSGNPDGEIHVAAEKPATEWDPTVNEHHQVAGHFKLYYLGGGEIPCVAPGVPEFPFVSAVVTSLGLIGALLIRRRQNKPK